MSGGKPPALSQGFALLRDDTDKRCGVDGAALFLRRRDEGDGSLPELFFHPAVRSFFQAGKFCAYFTKAFSLPELTAGWYVFRQWAKIKPSKGLIENQKIHCRNDFLSGSERGR